MVRKLTTEQDEEEDEDKKPQIGWAALSRGGNLRREAELCTGVAVPTIYFLCSSQYNLD